MGIERIELSGAAMVGRYPSESPAQIATKPRNYNNKNLQRQLAREAYQTARAREEGLAQDMKLKAQAEKRADINKINNNGLNAPAPEVKFKNAYVHQNFYHYNNVVGKIVDRMA